MGDAGYLSPASYAERARIAPQARRHTGRLSFAIAIEPRWHSTVARLSHTLTFPRECNVMEVRTIPIDKGNFRMRVQS